MKAQRTKLYEIIANKMSNQERKDWIYEHTNDQMILNIILDMPDDEVENELNFKL